TLISPRLSAADPRQRHLGLSHHTRSVLELTLAAVEVPLPAGLDLLWPAAAPDAPAAIAGLGAGIHRISEEEPDLAAYAESGLPRRTMGRDLYEDRLFFAAPLAAGVALGRTISS
nr:DUF3866 family protein [Solirubrobacterales bacterium]